MKALPIICIFVICSVFPGFAQRVHDFQLQDVANNRSFVLSQHQSATAIVLVFTTNNCPYSKLYEDRIMNLVNQYRGKDIVFALINPHAGAEAGESSADMAAKSQTKMNNLPYLSDGDQRLTQSLSVSKIPEAVVITHGPVGFTIGYQGAIDNNPQLPQSVTRHYLRDALLNISENKDADPSAARSVGCNVKTFP